MIVFSLLQCIGKLQLVWFAGFCALVREATMYVCICVVRRYPQSATNHNKEKLLQDETRNRTYQIQIHNVVRNQFEIALAHLCLLPAIHPQISVPSKERLQRLSEKWCFLFVFFKLR
jgi:hypothetical protein